MSNPENDISNYKNEATKLLGSSKFYKSRTILEAAMSLSKQRITQMHAPTKQSFIFEVQEKWELYAVDRTNRELNDLLKFIEPEIKRKARIKANRYKNLRIYADDFESHFWEKALKVVQTYCPYSFYYLAETINLAIERKTIDVVRKAQSLQNRLNQTSASLTDGYEKFQWDRKVEFEEDLVFEIFVAEIRPLLTQDEKDILSLLCYDPTFAYHKLARLLGYEFTQQVKRRVEKLKKKMYEYSML